MLMVCSLLFTHAFLHLHGTVHGLHASTPVTVTRFLAVLLHTRAVAGCSGDPNSIHVGAPRACAVPGRVLCPAVRSDDVVEAHHGHSSRHQIHLHSKQGGEQQAAGLDVCN